MAARPAVPLLADFLQPTVIWCVRPAFAVPPPLPVSGEFIGEGMGLHHDGDPEALLLEVPDGGNLAIEFTGFAGSYVSISIDVPEVQGAGLTAGTVLGVVVDLGAAVPDGAWCRLNLKEGPGPGLSRPQGFARREGGWLVTEFDLAELRGRSITRGWADLLLPPAASGRLTIGAPVVYLRPLAGF